MPGYSLLASDKDKLSPKYLCSYCKLLLRDAKQTSCGHFYCETCVGNLKKGYQMICLEDNEVIDPREVYPDNFVRREVLSLGIKCPNTDKGCKWNGEIRNLEGLRSSIQRGSETGDWSNGMFYRDFPETPVSLPRWHRDNAGSGYEEHIKQCEFQEVLCIHPDCRMKVTRRQLPSHLRTDCLHRTTRCDYCNNEVSVAKMTEHHKNECMMYPVSCPKCNKEGISRDLMSVHLDPLWGECSEIERPCPFSTIGCPVKEVMNKSRRSKHLAEKVTSHLSLLQKDYLDLKSRVGAPQAVGARSMSPVLNYPEGKKGEKMMKDLMVKIDALMQDNVNMRRKIAEQESQLLQMEQRLASASDVELASSSVSYKTPADKDSTELLKDLRKRITNVENTVAQTQVYHIDNIRRTSEQSEGLAVVKRKLEEVVETQKNLETRIHAQESETAMSNIALADLDTTLKEMKYITHDGILVWKITDVARRRTEAITGRVLSFYSPQFFSSPQGYRMCARIYLNGDGMGRGNYISLFFVLMRGEHDALLRWPFRQKVTLMLMDQDNVEHIIDAFRPDPSSSSFQKPRGEMNIASGCPMFCPLSELDKHAYIRDDTMFIKIIVDTMDMM